MYAPIRRYEFRSRASEWATEQLLWLALLPGFYKVLWDSAIPQFMESQMRILADIIPAFNG